MGREPIANEFAPTSGRVAGTGRSGFSRDRFFGIGREPIANEFAPALMVSFPCR
jgi:hypothetical protein